VNNFTSYNPTFKTAMKVVKKVNISELKDQTAEISRKIYEEALEEQVI